ncbi:MAG TPA: peptide chain release factor N(5)-glutamine methyltransferase [Actinomycetota bacterium]|nr:peptide chain release factor N(5)-glutamine methyltransferase [Actinomycetota bacterium]
MTSSLEEQVQAVLADAVVNIGPQEARWIAEAAADEQEALELAARRSRGEPLQYLLGSAQFRHIELEVGPGVFIPRPETELIAERAIELLPQGGTLVDLGTGSGAIALAVAHERPDATVLATEADPGALRWAIRNRDRIAAAVQMFQGDLFDGLPADLRGCVDVVVSNPPYVALERKDILPIDVRDHEPERALYGGADGMLVTTRLVRDARSWLKPGGWVVLEMSEQQQEVMTSLLEELGYEEIVIGVDLADWPRIVVARMPPAP